jgi:hypothetical protein
MYIHHALVAGDLSKGSEEFQAAADIALQGLERHDPKLSHLAVRVCGDRSKAAIWLATECTTVGGRIPLQLLLSGQRALLVFALAELEKELAREDVRVGK